MRSASDKIRFISSALFAMVVPSLCAYAQDADSDRPREDVAVTYPRSMARLHQEEILEDTHPVFVNGDKDNRASADSVKSLLELFYVDQYRQFHDPQAPYFMFLTRDANVAMGVGGSIKLRAWYDWHGVQDSYSFYPYNIAVPANPARRKAVAASPSQSQLFMTLLGRNAKIGTYKVYLNVGIENKTFKLNDAFIGVNDFTAGYTKSTFWDPDAYAPVVDGQGPNGQVSKRNVLLRYFHNFKSGWSVAGGIEFPSTEYNEEGSVTKRCPDYIPDLVALGQYSWDEGNSHIRLSALFRMLAYRDMITEKNHSVAGWGAQLSGRWQMAYPLSLYYQGVVGRGLGNYLGDLSVGNYDLIDDPGNPGEMNAPLALGVTAGLQYDISSKYFLSGSFGSCRYYNSSPESDEYKLGLYGTANFFWNITPRLQTGAGYLFGSRKNFSGEHAWMNRIQILLSFNF